MKIVKLIPLSACLLLGLIISYHTTERDSDEGSSVVFRICLKNDTARDLNITTMRFRIYNHRSNQTSIVHNDYLYVMGGDRFQALSWVEYARFNEDGTIGNFRLTSSFEDYRLE
ncbi:hypothetical protein ACFL27_23960 [candidate division CSSED10-310 bacterium]|uniref:Uncharacterized protein n=1 Tax=candidate division CSSED10-310 bacterium TaxID=2855610 RepID=A0ABV6Z490_UNCC1